jgi:hypothetical protein
MGVDNRTSTLRVIPGSAKSTRLESRCPGADINPYRPPAVVGADRGDREKLKPKDAPPGTPRKRRKSRARRNLMHATENLALGAGSELSAKRSSILLRTREWNGASSRTRSPIGKRNASSRSSDPMDITTLKCSGSTTQSPRNARW